MSERWVSNQRKFCSFCNCWYADNKASIDSHEKGASHLANVTRDLSKTRKLKQDQEKAERLLMAELHRIEQAAMRSFEEDAKRDPFAKDEMNRLIQSKSKSGPGPTNRY